MNISSSLIVSGLFLVLLSTKTEAKSLTQPQQAAMHLLGEEFTGIFSSEESGKIPNVNAKVRSIRGLNIESGSKSSLSWRIKNRRKNSKKKKGCFRLKMDKIGAMSKLGC